MLKKGWLVLALIMFMPGQANAEAIEGTLDDVSFSEEMVKVNGVVYEVNTEITRVIHKGEVLGEEDLRPGDDVVLLIGERSTRGGKPTLEAIILVRGSKSGLES